LNKIVSSAYLAGLVDSDAGVCVHVSQPRKGKFYFTPYIEIEQQYFAGLTDGDGSICLAIVKNEKNKTTNHEFRPTLKIDTDNRNMKELVEKFLAFCNTIGIKGSIYHRGGQIVRLHLSGCERVKRFLEAIRPYLIIKRKEADIMLTQIIPRLENGANHSKEEILQLMPWIEELNRGRKAHNRKYTLEYFKKLFKAEIE